MGEKKEGMKERGGEIGQEQHQGSKAVCSISHISTEAITLHFQLLCSSLRPCNANAWAGFAAGHTQVQLIEIHPSPQHLNCQAQ